MATDVQGPVDAPAAGPGEPVASTLRGGGFLLEEWYAFGRIERAKLTI
jgi:hypothetical protein